MVNEVIFNIALGIGAWFSFIAWRVNDGYFVLIGDVQRTHVSNVS